MKRKKRSDLDLLFDNPTTFKWEIEIRRVLHGDREYALVHLASAKSYIDKLITSCSSRAKTQATFHRALQRVVKSWDPASFERTYFTNVLFDLIAGFTPPSGSYKLFEFIKLGLQLQKHSGSVLAEDVATHRSALFALARYFESKETSKRPNFQEYTALLFEHLPLENYAGLVSGRLLQLGLLRPNDQRIKSLLQRSPHALDEILSFILDTMDPKELPIQIGALYAECLTIFDKEGTLFKETLEGRRIELVETTEHIFVRFHTGEELRLLIPTDQAVPVYRKIMTHESHAGYQKLVRDFSSN